jgi:hypothetical protein
MFSYCTVAHLSFADQEGVRLVPSQYGLLRIVLVHTLSALPASGA